MGNHYISLGRPGHGKTLDEVLKETELLLTASLSFSIHKDDSTGKKFISTGEISAWVPNCVHDKIYRTPEDNVPYVSDGKTSYYCAEFFKKDQDEAESSTTAATKKSKGGSEVPAPPGSRKPNAPHVPLPGMKSHLLV